MYKTKLQEICQHKLWSLPKYFVEEKSLDHIPLFQATVTVNGLTFTSDDLCKSSMDAQNEAAVRAFNYFSVAEFTPSEAAIPLGSSPLPDTDREEEANLYESKLNEFCPGNQWRSPDFTKKSPDHLPQFQATVTVISPSFGTHDRYNSSKDAQNNAASLAFDHFCPPTFPLSLSPIPSSSSLCANNFTHTARMKIIEGSLSAAAADMKDIPLMQKLQLKPRKTNQVPLLIGTSRHVKDGDRSLDFQHSHESQLQNYVQNGNISLPSSSCECDDPPHASHFKRMIRVGEKTYESEELSPMTEEAEHASAKFALMSLSENGIQEDESGYKNLLQELAQKECYGLPSYNTVKSGEAHVTIFVSTVEVERLLFTGCEAETKKRAEMSAARVAYMVLNECTTNQCPNVHQGKENVDPQEDFEAEVPLTLKEQHEKGMTNQCPNVHQGKENVDPREDFEAELPLTLKEQHEKEIKVSVDTSSIQPLGRVALFDVNDKLSSSSPNLSDLDEETEPPAGGTISYYSETSSSSGFHDSDEDTEPPAGWTTSCYWETSSSSDFHDSDEDTVPLAGGTISPYSETSSSKRVIVHPRAHPRSVPPGGTMEILNHVFVAHSYDPVIRGIAHLREC